MYSLEARTGRYKRFTSSESNIMERGYRSNRGVTSRGPIFRMSGGVDPRQLDALDIRTTRNRQYPVPPTPGGGLWGDRQGPSSPRPSSTRSLPTSPGRGLWADFYTDTRRRRTPTRQDSSTDIMDTDEGQRTTNQIQQRVAELAEQTAREPVYDQLEELEASMSSSRAMIADIVEYRPEDRRTGLYQHRTSSAQPFQASEQDVRERPGYDYIERESQRIEPLDFEEAFMRLHGVSHDSIRSPWQTRYREKDPPLAHTARTVTVPAEQGPPTTMPLEEIRTPGAQGALETLSTTSTVPWGTPGVRSGFQTMPGWTLIPTGPAEPSMRQRSMYSPLYDSPSMGTPASFYTAYTNPAAGMYAQLPMEPMPVPMGAPTVYSVVPWAPVA